MVKKQSVSIEEQIEDWCKSQLGIGNYFTKTEAINHEIKNALKKAPSKNGGEGTNYPDLQYLIETSEKEIIPVMIEVKGKKGDFIKTDDESKAQNESFELSRARR